MQINKSKNILMEESRDKKSIAIFKQIIQDIKTQKINAGDVLPSELELSKIYGVGRGSIREALYRSEERRVGKECRSRWSPYH